MARRVTSTLARLPWLACDRGGEVLGYAYAGEHRSRAAYQWSVEVSAYVGETWHRRGIGLALYESLFRVLALQGYVNACAGITLPNPASEGLHAFAGFSPVGVYAFSRRPEPRPEPSRGACLAGMLASPRTVRGFPRDTRADKEVPW
jgi:L-amino acid N-acyltransferase YncA